MYLVFPRKGYKVMKAIMSYDTIVVGLGSAGTTAASTLAKAGKKVLALEAMDRVGGRVNTVPFGDGLVELGAEWMHGTYPSRVFDAAVKTNIPLLTQSLDFKIYNSDGSSADHHVIQDLMEYGLDAADHPPAVPEPMGQYIWRKMLEYMNEKYPHLSKNTKFLDSLLFYMDLVVNSYESSNNWNDVSTASRYTKLEGHQHISWHKLGYKTFFEILLNTYNNGPGYPNLDIALNKEVSRITWPRQPAEDAVVSCSDGSVYRARSVIVTVSLGVLKERHANLFSPKLPEKKVSAISNLSIGVMDKIILRFDRAWWPSGATFFGFLWDKETREKVPQKDEWVTKIYAASCPLGNLKALTLWTTGDIGILVETLPEDLVKSKVMELLRRFMGKNIDIPEPIGIIRSNWYSNPYTRGSYTYDNLLTVQYPNSRVDLGEPLVDSAGNPRVLFAGEATNLTQFSTVHGASETGYKEAIRLLSVQSKL
ncbi:hypothetical protein O3G_MSEX009889 [Manduca sexta]|uniref:Amine oxidase domain-containing protein n=2 Tax=Manduca sexta TaxID=7130 RepID=A0A922CSG0_MANSE|nr:hypothetical protein O3G_MSEX009889 [Manduca sexta]